MNYNYRTNATSYSYSTNIMSPEYLYNLAKTGTSTFGLCNLGAGVIEMLGVLQNVGIIPWAQMPYTSGTCTTLPDSTQLANAATRKFTNVKLSKNDFTAIKTAVYNKHAIPVSISIDNNFYNAGPGFIWRTYGTDIGLSLIHI